MKKYLFCIGLLILTLSNLKVNSQINRIAENYPQIIDLSFTPTTTTTTSQFGASLFSDAGSWVGFSTPGTTSWVNGFCGPFTIDSRFWVSKSIAEIGVEKNGIKLNSNQFTRDSVCYFPGNLYMSSKCAGVKVEQQLFFINKNHSILQLNSDSVKWSISSTIWLDTVQVTKVNNSLVVLMKTGELVTVTFPQNFMLVVTGSSYTATTTNPSMNESIIISFYNNQNEKDLATVKPEDLLIDPTIAVAQSKDRWNGYLTKILRNDMPQTYNRVAVKSIVTLMANWRSAKGDILHNGVIPSHSFASFNGFWAWDSWKHAVALSHFEPNLAKDQVRAMFDYQTVEGMIPDNVFSDKTRINFKNSKPPLAVWAVMEIYNQTKDVAFLNEMFPKLLKYNRWWYSYRDHDQNGICEYGCTNGSIKCALFESGMDNAVRFDNTTVVPNGTAAYSMSQESVDLNAFLYLENKLLKTMSDILKVPCNYAFDAKKIDDYFYNNVNGYYYDKTTNGNFVTVEGTEAFIPLWSKIASTDKAASVITMIQKSTKFSTYIPFPTVCADNPNLAYDSYWRGPVWLDQVYFGISGIRNYGNKKLADQYTDQIFTRLRGLTASEPINENYDPLTGTPLRAPNFSWSAAHLLLLYLEYGKSLITETVTPWDGTAIATSYAWGDGTSTNPYQISTPAELAYLSKSVNAGTTYAGVFFILTNDLDLNSKSWTPIGNSTTAFKGTFDGNSHVISNLTVNLPITTGVGLFGYVQDALIKNIGIAGVSTVSGFGSVGGIIGRCVVYAASGFGISGCFSNATVSSVSSTDCVGGIVGIFRSTQTASPTNPNLIDNCYSTGNIVGNNYVTGIVGKVEYKTAGIGTLTISNSYATGLITATGTAPTNLKGGVVTKASTDAVNVTNCYYINGDAANANGAVAKMATVMQASGFVTLLNGATSNWKSDYTGGISVNNGFPILAWRITIPDVPTNIISTAGSSQVSVAFTDPASNGGSAILDYTITPYIGAIACTPVIGSSSPIVVSGLTNGTAYTFKVSARNAVGSSVASLASNAVTPSWDGTTIATSFAWGNGTAANPWQINSSEQLAYLSQCVNGGINYAGKYFILTNDLDLNSKSWTPIGKSIYSFNGIFDGNSHLISNLTVNLPTTSGVGLFGYVQDASIKNVGIVGTSTVTGSGNVGGIVGQFIAYSGSGFGISGCFSNATVSSAGGNVGGLVGYFRSTGTGISSLITNCYSTGNISGTNYVAGIVGKVEMNSGNGSLTISNSYSTGTMTATGTGALKGGIVTNPAALLTVTNCYYINGAAANANGAVAKTAAQMQASGFVTTLNGSQSPSAWQADSAGSSSVNNGFPILAWRTLNVATNITSTPIMNGKVTVIGKTVTFEAPVSIKNMQLYNFSGQLIKSKNINYDANQLSFDVQQAGIYLLIAHTAEGQLSQKIIIK